MDATPRGANRAERRAGGRHNSRRRLFDGNEGSDEPGTLQGMAALKYAAEQHYDNFAKPGRVYMVRHLTSARGTQLNGKRAAIVGRDWSPWPEACRMHVRVEGEPLGTPLKLHTWNLATINSFTSVPSATRVEEARCAALLGGVVAHFAPKRNQREDQARRLDFLRASLGPGGDRVPPPTRCCDPLAPDEDLDDFVRVMSHMRPCCYGDGQVDFRRFAEGLKGAGEVCAVCLQGVNASDEALGLPCGHIFHRACGAPWVAEHNSCPTCRFEPPRDLHDGGAFRVDNDEQLVLRLREWVVSGMCERCQIVCHERDPMVAITGADGVTRLIQQSRLEKHGLPESMARSLASAAMDVE